MKYIYDAKSKIKSEQNKPYEYTYTFQSNTITYTFTQQLINKYLDISKTYKENIDLFKKYADALTQRNFVFTNEKGNSNDVTNKMIVLVKFINENKSKIEDDKDEYFKTNLQNALETETENRILFTILASINNDIEYIILENMRFMFDEYYKQNDDFYITEEMKEQLLAKLNISPKNVDNNIATTGGSKRKRKTQKKINKRI